MVSADSRQIVIAVGCDDVSMHQEEFFIPEQYTPPEKNTSLYKIKLLFLQKVKKIIGVIHHSWYQTAGRRRKLGMFYMLFSYSYPAADQCRKPRYPNV